MKDKRLKDMSVLPENWKEIILAVGDGGKFPTEIVRELGITWYLHNKFLKESDEYSKAFECARVALEAWYDKMGRENVNKPGKEFNATLYIWLGKSKLGRREADQAAKTPDAGLANDNEKKRLREKYRTKDGEEEQQGESLN
jgi:hypothetical protein